MPPDIESPKTFGDYYWNAEVEAKRLRSEQHEASFSPIIGDYLGALGIPDNTPRALVDFLDKLTAPTEPDFDDLQRMFLGTVSRGVALAGGDQMAKPFEYEAAEKYLNQRIGPEQAVTLFQRKKITQSFYDHRVHSAGYADSEAAHLYNSMRPYPSVQELIRYGRYHSDADNPKAFVWNLFDVHADDWEMWNWLSVQKLSTEQVQTVYRRAGWDKSRSLLELSRLGWPLEEREALLNLAYQLPNAMLLVQGNLMQDVPTSAMIDDIAKAGIHPTYADKYFDGVLTKPNTQDLIAWQLRVDPSLSGLENELRKTGIHPNYFDTYKTLAHPIPPVQDLITMAVREAFTPEIAQRFGQYEGLPPEYVEAAEKKGLTKQWAERYWAAHWSLPSIQQGFGMLHRGIIGQADLSLLMRALDIMPFWRDKLMQLSFKPLTRVDVRRMHLLGTLDESGVTRAYRDVGYNDRNAALMTDFTVRYNRRSLAGFTQRDVITAYINRYIEAGQTTSILREIGIKAAEIPNIMRLASLKRDWNGKDEAIKAIRNRYTKGIRNYAQTRTDLAQVGLAPDYAQTLLAQWEPSAEVAKVATFTNAQTLKLFGMKLIDETRAREELKLIGFDGERRDLLIKSVTEQTE